MMYKIKPLPFSIRRELTPAQARVIQAGQRALSALFKETKDVRVHAGL